MNSADLLQGLEQYGIAILPGLAVAEQLGIPVPAVPALLGFGALLAHGRGNLPLMLSTMATAALIVDFGWYELGRRRGARVLAGLCRLSLEPDSCIRKAQGMFARYGVRAMLVAKFVPGLTTILPPLAGIFAVGRIWFALCELGGTLLWAGLWMGVGYIFSDAVGLVAARVARLGLSVGLVLGALLAAYIGVKYLRRRLFVRRLRTRRISPATLKRQLDAGEDVTILDLRTRLDVAAVPYRIPGSRWMSADDIDGHRSEIARARELVLYCS